MADQSANEDAQVTIDLRNATLVGADLRGALLEGTKLLNADISGSRIYGISVWDVKTAGLTQENLVITPPGQSEITVDSIEVAQFTYLLLNNRSIREVIDTISQKGVLILGRFTKERKAVLDAIRDRLRKLGFVPMMFDFEKPKQRDFTETIKTLAGLSRFIIADITNPKSSPLELQATMPDYMIPFVPINTAPLWLRIPGRAAPTRVPYTATPGPPAPCAAFVGSNLPGRNMAAQGLSLSRIRSAMTCAATVPNTSPSVANPVAMWVPVKSWPMYGSRSAAWKFCALQRKRAWPRKSKRRRTAASRRSMAS
jgi:hypothetical protein